MDENEEHDNEEHEDDGDGEKLLPQSEVSRIAAREAKRAAKAERERISAELGLSPGKAAELLKAQRDAEQKTQTEAERMLAEAKERETKAIERERSAAARELASRAGDALRDRGISGRAIRRVTAMLDLEPDADEDDIETAIDELESDLPSLFAVADSAGSSSIPSSISKRKKTKTAPAATSLEAGAELARARFAKK